MNQKNIKVGNDLLNEDEFSKLKEEISKDPKRKLVKVDEEYRILNKLEE